ncbi:MAG: nuclear transport factor 2 family protein [Novosphingobium sp.]|nr:nuclear transport factor 2 family protein [Novosphingobium sp.]
MQPDFADWLAICETKARYCRLMDTKDWDGWADCFTEDLVLDTSPAGGQRIEGRDQAIRYVRGSIDQAKTAHQVHNPEVMFDSDGQGASVTWAMNDRVEMAEDRRAAVGELGHTGYGHYRERYVKCADGKWRIKSSQLSYLHFDSRPLPPNLNLP